MRRPAQTEPRSGAMRPTRLNSGAWDAPASRNSSMAAAWPPVGGSKGGDDCGFGGVDWELGGAAATVKLKLPSMG